VAYQQNAEAVERFLKEAYPGIKKEAKKCGVGICQTSYGREEDNHGTESVFQGGKRSLIRPDAQAGYYIGFFQKTIFTIYKVIFMKSLVISKHIEHYFPCLLNQHGFLC
jgi:hypothetical protein